MDAKDQPTENASQPVTEAATPTKETKKMRLLIPLGIGALVIIALAAFFLVRFLEKRSENMHKVAVSITPTQTNGVLLVTGENPPFVSENIPGNGFATEIIRAVFAEMNTPVTIKFYPWARDELLVKNGEAFAAFPYAATPERAKTFLFSDTFAITSSRLFYYKRNKSDFTFTTFTDLKNYRIGAVSGYFYVEALKNAGVPYDLSDNEETALQKLVAGRVDLIGLDYTPGLELIKKKFPDQVANFGTLDKTLNKPENGELRLLVSKTYKGSTELLNNFNAALKRIVAKGIYTKILTDHQKLEASIVNH